MSIKKLSKETLETSKEKSLFIWSKIKESFIKAHKGEEKLNIMLWGWGIVPAILVVFFLEDGLRKAPFKILLIPIYLGVIAFFVWHIMAIRTTIKKHPEYKKSKKEKQYKGLSKKRIKELKRKERKEENINLVKKALLLKAWDSMEFYKIVILVDCFVILTQIQNILYSL